MRKGSLTNCNCYICSQQTYATKQTYGRFVMKLFFSRIKTTKRNHLLPQGRLQLQPHAEKIPQAKKHEANNCYLWLATLKS